MTNLKIAKLKAERAELVKLLEHLEASQTMQKTAEQIKQPRKLESIAYASGLHLLLDKNRFNEMMSSKNRIVNAYVTDSFKRIIPSIANNFDVICSQANTVLVKNFNKLNSSHVLTPQEDATASIAIDYLANFELKVATLLFEELKLAFNQGRQHETLAQKTKNIRKYIDFDEKADIYYENHMKNVFEVFKYAINGDFLMKTINDAYKMGLDKKSLLNGIKSHASDIDLTLQKFINMATWWTYTQGNIYQLAKDGVEYVQWNSSHCVQDCTGCRNIETGNEILTIGSENLSSFQHEANRVYYFEEIKETLGSYGMELFSHQGCRCQFIKAM